MLEYVSEILMVVLKATLMVGLTVSYWVEMTANPLVKTTVDSSAGKMEPTAAAQKVAAMVEWKAV